MRLLLLALLAASACGGSQQPADGAREPVTDGRSATSEPASEPAGEPGGPNPSADAPEISRSVGTPGGVIVLWPRIVLPRGSSGPDAETRRVAGEIQKQIVGAAARALPGHPGEIRPEPERVCPRSGCKAVSVGILLARAGQGCSVIAMVSAPGQSPARLVPWTGVVALDAESVGFREPPEKVVHVKDYERCSDIPAALEKNVAQIEAAIRAAAR